jgi:hypothetical protein
MIRRMRWAGYVACTEEKKNAYIILQGITEGRKPLTRHAYRWEDNIKIDIEEVECVGVGASFTEVGLIGGFL